MARTCAILLVLLAAFGVARPGVVLTEEDAPEWKVSEWINGDPGNLSDHTGRVVLIHFFQLWCPVSNEFTTPLFQRWDEQYGDRDDVLIVGIHSVFEGHDRQSPDALREWVRDQGVTYPVGIDAYADGDSLTPVTLQRYRAEGTPQVAIVDKYGKLRFLHFSRFDPYVVEGMIDRLLKEIGPQPGRAKPVAARPDPALSGRYRVTMAQTTKTCGRLIRPLTLDVELSVVGNTLRARSRQAYAGITEVLASIDPATGQFDARLNRRVFDQGATVNLEFELHGVLRRGKSPPELEYTFTLERDAPDPTKQCRIEGRGKGTKVDAGGRR